MANGNDSEGTAAPGANPGEGLKWSGIFLKSSKRGEGATTERKVPYGLVGKTFRVRAIRRGRTGVACVLIDRPAMDMLPTGIASLFPRVGKKFLV